MFFIIGINNGQKKLNYDQLEICKCCGKYGHLEVYMTYMVFTLFFIPIFKWNKKYYVKMSCCGAEAEINSELGRDIAKGKISKLSMDSLNFNCNNRYYNSENNFYGNSKKCPNCGYTTKEDFDYCPKCGNKI